jgi:anti-sigma-K factor RskA
VTCEERKDLLLLHAAGTLEATEAVELRAHLATGCPVCAGHLAEANATLAQLPLALEVQNPPPEAKKRLFARIATDQAAGIAAGSPSPAMRVSRARPAPAGYEIAGPAAPVRQREKRAALIWLVLSPALAASIAVFMTHRALSSTANLQRNQIRILTGDVQALNILLQSQSDKLNDAEQKAAHLQFALDDQLKWSLQPSFALAGAPAQPAATGRIYRDAAMNKWQMLAANLKPSAPGKTYELWFVPAAGKPVRAATFDPDASGVARLTVDVPQEIGAIAKAAVTDEPVGGTDQPTGHFQILGTVE